MENKKKFSLENVREFLRSKLEKVNRKKLLLGILLLVVITGWTVVLLSFHVGIRISLEDGIEIVDTEEEESTEEEELEEGEDEVVLEEDMTPVISDISDWQTYTSKSIGITVTFPSDWHYIFFSAIEGSLDLSNTDYSGFFTEDDPADFSVSLYAYDNTAEIVDWYQEYYGNDLSNVLNSKTLTIDGHDAIEVQTSYSGVRNFDYYIKNRGHVINIQYNYSNSEYSSIYKTIMENVKIPDLVIPEGSYTERQGNLFSTRISATMIDDSYYDYGSNSIVDNNGAISNGELVFTSPEYESFLVSENISAFLKGIRGYYDITGVIPDPQNSNSVIISTTDYDNHIFTFYTYNLITGDLNQFYRTQDINLSQSYVSAVGIQGSKLILSALPEGIGGGPCLNNWIDWSDNYYYIELSDVSQGIKHFTIPAYKLREEQEEVDQCMEDYYAEEEANENIQ